MSIDPKDHPFSEMETTPLSAAGTAAELGGDAGFGLTPEALRPLETRYELIQELGRGGMGIVFQARDRETGDVVALKIVNPALSADPEMLERFKSEMLLARKITHKNVCRMYELLRFGDLNVIAMEFVRGETLRSILKRTQGVSTQVGLQWAMQICSGLAEAHAQGVMHRDLKPENIVIDEQGFAKVMDFGLARSLDVNATQTQGISGTPAYMSPEQVQGKSGDERSDIYSLGLIFYELFTGKRAFYADSAMALLKKHLEETPSSTRDICPYLPQFLHKAIQRAIERNPNARFKSVAELGAALEEVSPVTMDDADIQAKVPLHVKRWTHWDTGLIAAALLALLYFCNYRNVIWPAPQMKLEVDALSAKREATALAAKLERKVPNDAEIQLEYDPDEYLSSIDKLFGSRRSDNPYELLKRADFPVRWKLSLEGKRDKMMPRLVSWDAGEIVINRKGKVVSFYSPLHDNTVFIPTYVAPAVEQRREIATRFATEVCGPPPRTIKPTEISGGPFGGEYKALWKPVHPPNAPAWAAVELWTEKPTRITCFDGIPGSEDAMMATSYIRNYFVGFFRYGLILLLLGALFRFAMIRGHTSTKLWSKLPWAVLIAVSGIWQLQNGILHSGGPTLVFGTVAAVAVLLVLLFIVEYRLLRWAPEKLCNLIIRSSQELLRPQMGISILRGAAAGILLLALQTAFSHYCLSFVTLPAFIAMVGGILDPNAIGFAMTTFSPALEVLATALFCSAVLGFVVMGLGYSELQKPESRRASRYQRSFEFGGYATVFAIPAIGLQLPLGSNYGGPPGLLLLPLVMGYLLFSLLWRYELLASMMAIFTFVLWSLNFPLLFVMSEVGNEAEWALFAGWGALILSATLIALRPRIQQQLRGFAAEA